MRQERLVGAPGALVRLGGELFLHGVVIRRVMSHEQDGMRLRGDTPTPRRSTMHPFGDALLARDAQAAVELLARDVVFRSPVVFKSYRGREAVAPILRGIVDVVEDFRYTREFADQHAQSVALMFAGRVGEREIEGCDFLHHDSTGAVDELVVMVRPMSGLHALAERMRSTVAGGPHTSAAPD